VEKGNNVYLVNKGRHTDQNTEGNKIVPLLQFVNHGLLGLDLYNINITS